jgi:gliding motility-associated-like protein
MIEKDNIKDLFAKGLQDHHVQVDPALWTSISSSIGAGAAKTGLGLLAKTLIGVAASVIISGAVYLSLDRENPTPKKQEVKTLREASKPKESKEVIPTQPTKPTVQTLYYDPLQIGCFPIFDDTEFGIPDFDAQTSSGTSTEVQSTTVQPIVECVIPKKNTPIQDVTQELPPLNNVLQQQRTIPKIQVQIALPNIFTPNGDGQNETLQFDWKQNTIEDFSIVVLNKENQVVFSSSNPYFDWDGSDLGSEKLARGAYVYFVAGVLNGQKWQQSSSLQIQY